MKKLLKYLGTLYNDKETLLQHAVIHLSENNYPADGDAQWEIDAAIDKMKKVVISPPLPPKKKDPKSYAERDNFVSKWITQTDFKKAMESAFASSSGSDTGTSAGAGASNLAGSDSGSFGFSNPDSCSLSLGLPIPVPSGTSIRSLGTSVASIANSPGSSSGYAPFSSGSSIASDQNDDEKTSKFVQNSFDGSPDSVKHLGAESATNTSDEKNLKPFCQVIPPESNNKSNIRQSAGSYPLSGQNTTIEKSRIGKSVDLNQAGIKNSDVQESLEMEVDFGGGSDIDTQKFYIASQRAKLTRERKQALKALARYNELEAQRTAASRDDNKTKDNVNKLKKDNAGGKSGSPGLFTTDGALKTDVKPKSMVSDRNDLSAIKLLNIGTSVNRSKGISADPDQTNPTCYTVIPSDSYTVCHSIRLLHCHSIRLLYCLSFHQTATLFVIPLDCHTICHSIRLLHFLSFHQTATL